VQTSTIQIFQQHHRRYGVRRMVVELQEKGIKVGSYQVRQVLQQNGLRAIQPLRSKQHLNLALYPARLIVASLN